VQERVFVIKWCSWSNDDEREREDGMQFVAVDPGS
jgi:hypothetical protein